MLPSGGLAPVVDLSCLPDTLRVGLFFVLPVRALQPLPSAYKKPRYSGTYHSGTT